MSLDPMIAAATELKIPVMPTIMNDVIDYHADTVRLEARAHELVGGERSAGVPAAPGCPPTSSFSATETGRVLDQTSAASSLRRSTTRGSVS